MTISDFVQHLTLRPKDYFKDINEIPYTDHSPIRLLKDELDNLYLSNHLTSVNYGHVSFVLQNKHRRHLTKLFGLYGTNYSPSHRIQTALRG